MTAPAPAGRLWVVATPIGNLEDITLRALRCLKEADCIAAEDTRHTRKLLSHYDVHRPLVSYYREREHERAGELLGRLRRGERIALVSDAGTPGVSDPGLVLIQRAVAQGIPVEVIPGPSAVLAALLGSGMSPEEFSFHGFLAPGARERRDQLQRWKHHGGTQIFFISPHRLSETLGAVLESWGDRPAVLARELTKLHEEFIRGKLSELILRQAGQPGRGEYTLLVSGAAAGEAGPVNAAVEESLEAALARLQAGGLRLNQAVARLSQERGLPRREVYRLAHAHTNPDKTE